MLECSNFVRNTSISFETYHNSLSLDMKLLTSHSHTLYTLKSHSLATAVATGLCLFFVDITIRLFFQNRYVSDTH